MSLNQYTQKIDRYLSKNEGLPIVVDVQNEADQIELVQHYHVGKNELITASKYCAPDEMPRYEELLNDLATLDGVLIVTGTTSYLKLDGEQELQRFIVTWLNNGCAIKCSIRISNISQSRNNRYIILLRETG